MQDAQALTSVLGSELYMCSVAQPLLKLLVHTRGGEGGGGVPTPNSLPTLEPLPNPDSVYSPPYSRG